jgi:yecA family protein
MSDTTQQDSDFDWLASVYNSQGAINHPSELHGLMTGYLSAGYHFRAEEWLDQVRIHMGIEEFDTSRQVRLEQDLIRYYQDNLELIEQNISAFQILLPDDDYSLSERTESLSVWVRGYLEGVALAAGPRLTAATALQEVIRDLVAVTQLDPRVGEDEGAEKDFFEVSEFVRVSVQTVFAELNDSGNAADNPPDDKPVTLH